MDSAGAGGFFWCSDEFPRSPGAGSLLPVSSIDFVRIEVDERGRERLFFRLRPWNDNCMLWIVPTELSGERKL